MKKSTTIKDLHPSHKELFEKISNERQQEQQRKKKLGLACARKVDSRGDLLKELGVSLRVIKPLKETGGVTKFSPLERRTGLPHRKNEELEGLDELSEIKKDLS